MKSIFILRLVFTNGFSIHVISGNKSRNINEYQKNIAKKKDVLFLQEQHFVSLQANQKMEKEALQIKLQREEELHTLNVEAIKLEIENTKAKRLMENQLYSEELANRVTKRKREEELFKLEQERFKYEILVLRNSLGYNDLNQNSQNHG